MKSEKEKPQILGQPSACHRAGWVVVRPDLVLANAFVRVEGGIIREIGRCKVSELPGSEFSSTEYFGAKPSDAGGEPTTQAPLPISNYPLIDHGPGVLLPGLVNAHVHLELTALQGRLDHSQGFEPWVRDLLVQREKLGNKALETGARQGISQLMESGTLFAGEISTLGLTYDPMKESGLGGVWFREMLGGLDYIPDCIRKNQKSGSSVYASLAGHAPHTTSPELLWKLKQKTRTAGLPFSLHLAESPAEGLFIRTAKGPWASFLKERGIQISGWPLPARSPVAYARQLNLLDSTTLAVHLLDTDREDLKILAQTETCPVLCPRSNLILHGLLPDLPQMLALGLYPALGTDSLASNDSLSLFDEMAVLADRFPGIHPREILAMATVNGARVLGLEKMCGTLEKGKSGAMIYLPLTADNEQQLLEKIITR